VKRALLLGALVALVLPAAASAHAVLLKTTPAASELVNTPPAKVSLVYSEAVEPRFAIVSVTDASGAGQTSGPPTRSATDPHQLDVPLKKISEGWYLVFWRVISADGHPVRGVFTFSVGPNPGPQPQFVLPSLSETAATPTLIVLRWLVFLTAMSAIGLFVLRSAIARPLLAERPRALTLAFWIAVVAGLVVTPIYLLEATAQFALRSFWDIRTLVPLMQKSAFGRGYLHFELVLALFAVAGGISIWLDRGLRPRRTIAELLALAGAGLAAAGLLLVPGASGHAAQTSPRSLMLTMDWLHLASGSLWIGGLIGLLLLRRSLPALVVCVPRFSAVAFVSVAVLLSTGVVASIVHLPTFASLWQTSYGKAIVVKIILLLGAMALASQNLLRTKPALSREHPPESAAVLLRRLVAGETVLVAGAIAAAAVLTSLAPPPKALAGLGSVAAHSGPGAVSETFTQNGYRIELHVTPNRAAVPNDFTVHVTRSGAPVTGADVTLRFTMLDMEMPAQEYKLAETAPGTYAKSLPALVMVGRWGLALAVNGTTTTIVDKAGG
jgi:copper transport protein